MATVSVAENIYNALEKITSKDFSIQPVVASVACCWAGWKFLP